MNQMRAPILLALLLVFCVPPSAARSKRKQQSQQNNDDSIKQKAQHEEDVPPTPILSSQSSSGQLVPPPSTPSTTGDWSSHRKRNGQPFGRDDTQPTEVPSESTVGKEQIDLVESRSKDRIKREMLRQKSFDLTGQTDDLVVDIESDGYVSRLFRDNQKYTPLEIMKILRDSSHNLNDILRTLEKDEIEFGPELLAQLTILFEDLGLVDSLVDEGLGPLGPLNPNGITVSNIGTLYAAGDDNNALFLSSLRLAAAHVIRFKERKHIDELRAAVAGLRQPATQTTDNLSPEMAEKIRHDKNAALKRAEEQLRVAEDYFGQRTKRVEEELRKADEMARAEEKRRVEEMEERLVNEELAKQIDDIRLGIDRAFAGSVLSTKSAADELEATEDEKYKGKFVREYEVMWEETFQPAMEEYDMLRWDPYSFSGAPIGGWGRATRSRLATLPIRLVTDFGGMDLMYASDDEADGGDDTTEAVPAMDPSGQSVMLSHGKSSVIEATAEVPAAPTPTPQKKYHHPIPTDLRRSIGPHWTIYDATGQRFVCRTYDEDELVVLSRVDSAFLPAISVWDDESRFHHMPEERSAIPTQPTSGPTSNVIKKKFEFQIHGNNDVLPDEIISQVGDILMNMGMNAEVEDVAEVQAQLQNMLGDAENGANVEVDVMVLDNVLDMERAVDELQNQMLGDAAANADARDDAEITRIITAAALGAKKVMSSPGGRGSGGGRTSGRGGNPNALSTSRPSVDEVVNTLHNLRSVCSQLHMGWWSYEWCHAEAVRQFHVEVFRKPVDDKKYEIQDVTAVGMFNGAVRIIYPAGEYDGVHMAGRTITLQHDAKGKVVSHRETSHTKAENRLYRLELDPTSPLDKPQLARKAKGLGGPIVEHTFDHGDFCKEAGLKRKMTVELRCCLKEDIDSWLQLKNKKNGQNQSGMTGDSNAVLVDVKEDKTCVYRSRVCTPLLCPAPAGTTESNSGGAAKDHVGGMLKALGDKFSYDFSADDDVRQEFEEMVNTMSDDGDLSGQSLLNKIKERLNNNKKKSGGVGATSVKLLGDTVAQPSVEKGDSIRKILEKTLGKKCISKNLGGWWTYEFCHNDNIRQYHATPVIDAATGLARTTVESEHFLGSFDLADSLYPDSDEHLHVVNATDPESELAGMGASKKPKTISRKSVAGKDKGKGGGSQPGGNGAVYVQEYLHGDVCDHEDVSESVIRRGGDITDGIVERSSTVRFLCGSKLEIVNVQEDETCHYILDVSVPGLCEHELFRPTMTKTQVVKCLPFDR